MEERLHRALRLLFLAVALFIPPGTLPRADAEMAPPLTLARIYHQGIDLRHYWVSEKLDGIRAYWDGKRLISRRGHPFTTPPGFTAGFPAVPLDGELWCGRGCFQRLSSIVRDKTPDNAAWRSVRYMVFDLPASPDPFSARLTMLKRIFQRLDNPHIGLIRQYRIPDHEALMQKLEEVTSVGGEGLMLHHEDALYRAGRSADLLKVKSYQDAEARVVAHLPGKGKYRGMVGALLVETPEGVRFSIGSGLSDQQRREPPPIGTVITYRHNGKTRKGIPRFARFLRIYEAF